MKNRNRSLNKNLRLGWSNTASALLMTFTGFSIAFADTVPNFSAAVTVTVPSVSRSAAAPQQNSGLATLSITNTPPGNSTPISPAHAAIVSKIETIYRPIAAREGGTFAFEINPADASATASAHRDRLDQFRVRLAIGFLRQVNLTDDILRFTICHELGHLFGGHPHRPAPMEWPGPFDENGDMVMSAEGQSDYFASLKCMRLVLNGEDNVAYVRSHEIDPVVKTKCDEAHEDPDQSAICQRSAMGGYGLLRLVYPFPIAFNTPSEEIASETIRGTYPSRQCRLDTILAGALCQDETNAPGSAQISACLSRTNGAGSRPPCWFKE